MGPDSGSFVVAGLPGVNMSQGLSRNNHSNRSLTVAAQNRVPSRNRKGAVLANWHGYFLTNTKWSGPPPNGRLGLLPGNKLLDHEYKVLPRWRSGGRQRREVYLHGVFHGCLTVRVGRL